MVHILEKEKVEKSKKEIFLDSILTQENQVTFYIDLTNEEVVNAPIQVIYGTLETIGIKRDTINFKEIVELYDEKNEIGEVTGTKEYKTSIFNKIKEMDEKLSIYIPIKSEYSNNERIWLNVYMNTLNIDGGKYITGTIKNDIAYREVENNLIINSYKDPLTGLFNRKTCYQHVTAIKEGSNVYGAYIDLDKFKSINDLFGHLEGDETLQNFGKLLKSLVQEKLIFYRLAGDEFFVQIGERTEDEVKDIMLSILRAIKSITYGNGLTLTCSIGVVKFDEKGMKNVDLITYADNAMYQSKYRGGNCITFIGENGKEIIYDK